MARQVFDQHGRFKEASITHRRFKHNDLVPLLEKLRQNSLFQVQVVGKSVEKRDIYLIKAGTGKNKVMLWSQMHGDESTATMALLDIFNFLQASDDLDPIRQEILKNNTLYFVPMLNPDGAEQFRRRNALDIDLNRDALRLQSPEAQLLKGLRDSIKPDFGFNLHDQSRFYTVGTTGKPATISFLAPAFNHKQTVNEVRERAMRTIVGMNESIQQFIPGQVAKYSDEHEPRAFGDNIQKWGTSLILIESGGYQGDPEKQYIRQLNFAAILAALQLIGEEGYKKHHVKDYYKIPENERYLYDVVLRKVRYRSQGRDTLLDVGIVRNETSSARIPQGFYHRSTVEEIGDMSVFSGYEELNAEGLFLVPGKVYDTPLASAQDLTPERTLELLSGGFTTVKLENVPTEYNPVDLPLNVVAPSGRVNHGLALDRGANFTLQDQAGQVRYAIVNGFIYDLSKEKPALFHGLVL
ncbi:peptidase M14 [Rufibacter latericius]|uniref:Peptidase M14 n=2 Tax=Rufibacter latericius TaxID=2487040 RepID=A0A3M9MB18_9BACT|nr:peptidase M14 [Rufibacter latericius]